MREAGFTSTSIEIETPVEESLQSCHKIQNENRDLLENVKQRKKAGLQVSGGFIVGFDSDTSTIFQRQIDFIQKSGIVSAMVGLLNAPKNTRLYEQMEEENRLTVDATGSNTDFTMNFISKMDKQKLLEGYHRIINSIYKERPYYKRLKELFRKYKPVKAILILHGSRHFLNPFLYWGFLNKSRFVYWKFMIWTIVNKPKRLEDAITFAVYGYHFRTVYGLRQVRHKY